VTGSAVAISDVAKKYRVYHERNQSLKSAILRRRRASYEDFWALRDINLEIPEGSTFGLVGDNGSGKSTLLKCIARILVPNSGEIRTRGTVAALLELGSGFHPELSGRENVFLNGSILGMQRRDIEARFDSIVDFSGVEAFIDQPVKNYSSGMYVRLAFSVAINVDPDVLLVDEVLAVGDASFQEKCLNKFADYRAMGKTVVIVSHSLGTVRSMCDQAGWLSSGRLVDVGTAVDIVDRYGDTGHGSVKEASGAVRHGSGEIRVTHVDVIQDGVAATSVQSGSAVTLRMHYQCSTRVERPNAQLSLFSSTGTLVWGTAMRESGYLPDAVDGVGYFDFCLSALDVRAGTYSISSELSDEHGARVYDHVRSITSIDVTRPPGSQSNNGVVELRGGWAIGNG
jgi:ABC-2 type transport system ATP-binding protein